MLEAKQLKKSYGVKGHETRVLHGIDLKISDGEFVAITGQSGAGKSTLLYQLSLIDKPTDGQVMLDDTVTSELSERDATRFRLAHFGFVFQDYALVPELTAVENVLVVSLMAGTPYKKAKEESRQALTRLGMEDKWENLPSQLSGGEQQRVAIARAVSRKPRILFADEPTASLDSENSENVLSELTELHKSGQTIVMITHERQYAERAKRIVEIVDGRIASDSAT